MLDVKKIKEENKKEIVHPVKIFSALPNKDPKYDYLRDVQSEVLNKWFDNRNCKENIIKMNTGGGKTTVSLLILQSCLNERTGNAIYVVPDNYLIEQVKEEAKCLGINVTDDVENTNYIRNKAILIISIQKLVNGKSIFSKKSIDNILIDDVHACLEIAINQFKILIENNSTSTLYREVLSLFKPDLENQSYFNFLNIEQGVYSSNPMLVPFWAVQNKYKELLQILNKHKSDPSFTSIEFAMGLIGDIIDMCNIVVSNDQIEITPDCIPIEKISGFENAKRRIYVSATLKDDGDLLNSFNIDVKNIKTIITPENASDIGNRIILYPQINNPSITDEEIKSYLKNKSSEMRIVVIVPSRKKVSFWQDVADRIFDKSNIEDVKKYDTGLDIIINRYNGIDLKGKLCSILVIDGIPNSRTKYDEIKEIMLLNTNISIKNQMQKIEQGMGRGIRSHQDCCGIIFMGKNLSNIIYENGAKNNFSISTLKQFELSESLYDELANKSLPEILENLDLCIKKQEDWISYMNEALIDIKYENTINYDQKELTQISAYRYAIKRNFEKCIKEIQENINHEEDCKIRGYYKMQLAKYTNFFDAQEAQNILISAKEDNPSVLLPLNGYTYKKQNKPIENQAKNLSEYIQKNYKDEKEYFLKMNLIINNLVFAPETHRKFEEAICELANNIGFFGSMPEKEIGKGPDDLWNIGMSQYLVIECKNEAVSEGISKSDCGQLLNSFNWAKEEYSENSKIIGVIIHKSNYFEKSATPDKDFMILTQKNIEKLVDNLRKYSAAVGKIPLKDLKTDKLKDLLDEYKLSRSLFLANYLSKPQTQNKKG